MGASNVSSEFVRAETGELPESWDNAGVWLDVIFVAMVLTSVVGLGHFFLSH